VNARHVAVGGVGELPGLGDEITDVAEAAAPPLSPDRPFRAEA
jgi:hypothetical protein